jgi:epoxyqueuosine reductase
MVSLEDRIKQRAHALGFELAGIAPATPADGFSRLRSWLEMGFAGDMTYMHRHAEARRDPRAVLPEVRSVVMVAMNYKPVADCPSPPEGARSKREMDAPLFPSPPQGERGRGEGGKRPAIARISRYARGADYHEILRSRLNELLAWIRREIPGCKGRGVVDTAPLLERDFARRAGLGWFGKNTMLLNKRLGSYFFLGALLLDIDLRPDPSHESSHCGTCTACLDACPTQAFSAPGLLDSRRCISYLTIELKGPVPEDLRPAMGDWLFGCDVCQEVCPWNRKPPAGREPGFLPRADLEAVDPEELLGLSERDFRERFEGTALLRSKRRGLLRNAAIMLGNRGSSAALPALRRALNDPEPLVREAVAWAIEQILARSSAQMDAAE